MWIVVVVSWGLQLSVVERHQRLQEIQQEGPRFKKSAAQNESMSWARLGPQHHVASVARIDAARSF